MNRMKQKRKLILVFATVFLIAGITGRAFAGDNPLFSSARFAPKSVIALYKSSESQTKTENEILYYCSTHLSGFGLQINYWDIDAGLPPQNMVDGSRAVISWFRGPSMNNPEEYINFLTRAADGGKKVIILDNFGAYQNRRTGEYLEPQMVNLVLSRLGILYAGDWTQNGSLLRIAGIEPAVAELEAKQDPGISAFFYKFIPVDGESRVYLSLKRTDRTDDPSPVILTNRTGGFALSTYIYRVSAGTVKMMLNVGTFLRDALFPAPDSEHLAIFSEEENPQIARIMGYLKKTLDRSSFSVDYFPKTALINALPEDLRGYTGIGFAITDDTGLRAETLEGYLANGGTIVNLFAGYFPRLAPLLGADFNDKWTPTYFKPEGGFRFRYGFTPGDRLALDNKDFSWVPGSLKPLKDANIIAANYGGDVPLAWYSDSRQCITWNWDGFETGDYAGLMLESFMAVRPASAVPHPGIGVFFIDDWPLPMFNIKKKPLTITDTEFYTKQFWPDIKNILSTAKIPYTSFIVFNYNATVQPPFTSGEFFVADGNASLKMARDILQSGNELGLHGYNHMSLTTEPTGVNLVKWPDQTAIELMLASVREEWSRLFGIQSLPYSYAAPNNIISPVGEAEIAAQLPSVKVVATLFASMGEETTTGLGPDRNTPGLYYFPRTSFGYVFGQGVYGNIASSVLGLGMVSHFIHPDDVFDPDRSKGKSWSELKADLGRIISFIKQHYPWIRFTTLRQAVATMSLYDGALSRIVSQPGRLIIKGTPGIQYRVRLQTNRPYTVTGGTIMAQSQAPTTIIVEATGPETVISF